LVVSYRGAQGGYSLARPPAKITVAQIIHALEGPIAFTECSVIEGLCSQEASCAVRANWQKINIAIRGALDGVTLAQMIEPATARVELRSIMKRSRARA
jgi:Rrf2 family protein